MDSNISDLLGGVLSNPEMMSKVQTLLPLVSQMMKSSGTNTSETPAPPVQPAPVINQAAQPDNVMANANVAAAIQNLITALNASNQSNQANQSSQSNQTATPVQDAVPVFAAQTQQQFEPEELPQPEINSDAINIEKTLNTLKNVSAVASPENDHRAKLLLSLKPFLKESRRTKIDTAIKYINAAKIFSMFGKNGFVK